MLDAGSGDVPVFQHTVVFESSIKVGKILRIICSIIEELLLFWFIVVFN